MKKERGEGTSEKLGDRNLVGNRRVLIVEDDAGLAEILSLMLIDYDLAIATDGDMAVQTYIKFSPALVLMDIVMPKMSGINATKEILGIDPNAKIIGLTAFGRKWKRDLLEAGALEVIDKPFTKKGLIKIVERYLDTVE